MHNFLRRICAALVIALIAWCNVTTAVERPATPPQDVFPRSDEQPETDPKADAAVLNIKTRRRVKVDGKQDQFRVVERSVSWNPAKTAIVIVDMWDTHHCKSAAARVVEMAPHVNRTITAARDKGVFIIHAPKRLYEVLQRRSPTTPSRARAAGQIYGQVSVEFF